jgi:tetratricopeptide (TPR) repeat protein
MKKIIILLFIFLTANSQAQIRDKNETEISAYGYLLNGSYQTSVGLFNSMINNCIPVKAEWYLYRGIAKFYLGEFPQAEIDFNEAIEKGEIAAYIWKGRVYAGSGKSKEAVMSVGNYLKFTPDPDLLMIKQDSLLKTISKTDDWFDFWQSDWQNSVQKLLEDVRYYLKIGEFRKAHNLIDVSVEQSNNPLIYAASSEIYAQEDNLALALSEINTALTFEATNVNFLKMKAGYQLKLLKYKDAIGTFSQILFLKPGDFNARYGRSFAAFLAEDYNLAKSDVAIYRKFFDSDSVSFLSAKIEYNTGNYRNTLHLINPLLEKDKSKAEYFKLRGMTFYQTQLFNQAAYDLSMSLDLVPDDAESNFYLGLTEKTLGNKSMACFYLNRAVKHGEKRAIPFQQEVCEKE